MTPTMDYGDGTCSILVETAIREGAKTSGVIELVMGGERKLEL